MKTTYFTLGFHKYLNFVAQLSDKAWHHLQQEYHLNNKSYLQWLQLMNSIPDKWKFTIKQTGSDAKNLSTNKVTSVMYFETMFNANYSDWTKIFK